MTIQKKTMTFDQHINGTTSRKNVILHEKYTKHLKF